MAKRLDVNQLAKHIADVATGDAAPDSPKDEKAVRRGKARAAKLSPEKRKEIA
jgi:hypothetical protein